MVSAGAVVVIVGAAITLLGTFLNMVEFNLRLNGVNAGSLSKTYFDADDGKVVAAIAVVVLVAAFMLLIRVTDSPVPTAFAAVGGLAILGLAIYDRVDVDNSVNLTAAVRRTAFRALVDVDIGPGLYVCMGGGVLIVLGAFIAARRG